MSQSPHVKPILSATSLANRYSDAVELKRMTISGNNFSFQTTFTGAPTGSLYVQVSNDENTPVNWTTDTSGAYMNISGSAATTEPYVQFAAHRAFCWARLRWDSAGATSLGTIAANVCVIE